MGYEGKKAPANKGNKGEAKQEQWLQVGDRAGRLAQGWGMRERKHRLIKATKGRLSKNNGFRYVNPIHGFHISQLHISQP